MQFALRPQRFAVTPHGQYALDAAIAHYEARRIPEAAAAFRDVLSHEPDNPTALYQLGMCHYRLAQHEAALPYFARVTVLRPLLPDPWFRFAACSLMTCDHVAAARGYSEALRLAPGCPHYHHGAATLACVEGRWEAALAGFRRAREYQPDYPWATFSEGLTLLGMGRWLEGWPLMEARRRIGVGPKVLQDRRQWRGQDLSGESILLRTEQGLGDMIQFARYVPQVQARGGVVVVETRRELVRLFASLGADQIVQAGTGLPATDWQDSLMSQGLRFGTTPETVPWSGSYLGANAADVVTWQRRLAHLPRPRVGICWTGGPPPAPEPSGLAINRRRALVASQVAQLVAVPGISWVSLQPAHEAPAGVFDTRGLLDDMADTAALVACLDLVVTVDTSMVHLAGAMACPVWMFDRADKCWRWLPGREDSPWYPTLRIFRQAELGAWQPVIEAVCEALSEFRWGATASPLIAHMPDTNADPASHAPAETG